MAWSKPSINAKYYSSHISWITTEKSKNKGNYKIHFINHFHNRNHYINGNKQKVFKNLVVFIESNCEIFS